MYLHVQGSLLCLESCIPAHWDNIASTGVGGGETFEAILPAIF